MKNKFKVFVKKIKNWLSSLSKWAKKNYNKLIILFLSILLLLSTAISNNCNKKTAKAANINATGSLLLLPSVSVITSWGDLYTNPMYLCKEENGDFRIYYGYSTNTKDLVYTSRLLEKSGDVYVAYISLWGFRYSNLNNASEGYIVYEDLVPSSIIDRRCFVSLSLKNTEDIYNSTHLDYSIWGDGYDGSGVVRYESSEFTLRLEGLYNTRYYNYWFGAPTYINASVNVSTVSQALIQQSYSNGFGVGYSQGYDVGYEEGLVTAGVDTTPFGVLVNSVNSFLKIDIFGNVSIADLLSIAFGLIMLGIVIKIFLGG